MKNILFSLVVFFGVLANAQIKPNHDGVNLTPLTTTEIQALSGPLEGDLQYNSTTATIWRYNGTAWADTGGGSSDHGALTGLGDDDHTQYHNDARAASWLSALYPNLVTDGTNYALLTGGPSTQTFNQNTNEFTNIIASGVLEAGGLRAIPRATPIGATNGSIYYDSDTNQILGYVNGSPVDLGQSGGDVTKVGTPLNEEIAIWTGDGTLGRDSRLTYDGTSLTNTTSISAGFHMSAGGSFLNDPSGLTTVSGFGSFGFTGDELFSIKKTAGGSYTNGDANTEMRLNLFNLSQTRTYLLPDKDGTFAMLDDITGGSGTPDDDSVTPAKMADGDFGAFSVNNNVASIDADAVGSSEVDLTDNYTWSGNHEFPSLTEINGNIIMSDIAGGDIVSSLIFTESDGSTARGTLDYSDNVGIAGIQISNTTATSRLVLKDAGGLIVEGEVDVDNNKITNLADPTSPQDGATKAYVDASSGGLSTDNQNRILNAHNMERVFYTTENVTTTLANQTVQSGILIGSKVINTINGANSATAELVNVDASKIDRYSFSLLNAGGQWDITSSNGFVADNFSGNTVRLDGIGNVDFEETGVNTGTFNILPGANVSYVTTGSLIPAAADLASLQTYITAEEQTGADGSAVTTVTDQKGNITGITATNVTLDIEASTKKAFEVAGTGRIDLGDNINFGVNPAFALLMVTGTQDMDAATFVKADNSPGDYHYAIYNSQPGGAGTAYYYGNDTTEGTVTLQGSATDGDDYLWMIGNGDGTFDIRFNGATVLDDATWGTGSTTASLLLGAQVNGGGYNDQSTGSFRVFAYWNATLTPAELTAIEAAGL